MRLLVMAVVMERMGQLVIPVLTASPSPEEEGSAVSALDRSATIRVYSVSFLSWMTILDIRVLKTSLVILCDAWVCFAWTQATCVAWSVSTLWKFNMDFSTSSGRLESSPSTVEVISERMWRDMGFLRSWHWARMENKYRCQKEKEEKKVRHKCDTTCNMDVWSTLCLLLFEEKSWSSCIYPWEGVWYWNPWWFNWPTVPTCRNEASDCNGIVVVQVPQPCHFDSNNTMDA